jgi:hypothetical protein
MDETKRSPLNFATSAALPRKTHSSGFWAGDWITFAFLLLFGILSVAGKYLGVSNALLVGDRRDGLYNLCMVLSLFIGSFAFVVHTFALPSLRGQGWGWVVPKLIFFGIFWGVVLAAIRFAYQ